MLSLNYDSDSEAEAEAEPAGAKAEAAPAGAKAEAAPREAPRDPPAEEAEEEEQEPRRPPAGEAVEARGPLPAEVAREVRRSPPPEAAEEEAPAPPSPTPAPPAYTLAVVSARGLRNADWLPGTGKSDDCYCVVRAAGGQEELLRTRVVEDAVDPVWDEDCEVTTLPVGGALEFGIWDSVSGDFLGRATLERSSFEVGGFNGELALEGAGEGISAFLRVKVKAAESAAYPPGPPAEFGVEVDRVPGKPLGLDLDVQDSFSAYVVSIKDGPFQTYNEGADPAARLSVGDFVVSVNGVSGKGSVLLEQMKRDASLRLLVRKPLEFSAVLARGEPGRKLGLEVGSNLAGQALLIIKVAEGLVKEWNQRSLAKAVRAGDRIVAVGGRRGSAQDLKTWLVEGKACHVTVARPSGPGAAQG